MFLSGSHFNVSSFALKVSAMAPSIRTSCELRMAMFLRRRDFPFTRFKPPSLDGQISSSLFLVHGLDVAR